MTIYMANDFRDSLQTDIWVLSQILSLPDNPPPEMTSTYDEQTGITTNHIKIVDDICMPARRAAVKQYRSALSPVFFTLTQKVYAELFRVFLGQNNLSANGRQVDIQKKIEETIIRGTITSLVFFPIFQDRADFDSWWQGTYQYEKLREARNQVVHDEYEIVRNHLYVKNSKGNVVLNWDIDAILLFAQGVLGKANAVCAAATP